MLVSCTLSVVAKKTADIKTRRLGHQSHTVAITWYLREENKLSKTIIFEATAGLDILTGIYLILGFVDKIGDD